MASRPTPTAHRLGAVARRVLADNRPGLSLHSVRGTATSVVAHSPDGSSTSALGLRLDPRDDAIVARADAVIAASPGPRRSATLVLAVERHGLELCFLSTGTSDQPTQTTEPKGWLVDACRRSLGRPTSPDMPREIDLPLALWLDRVMVHLVHGEAPITWHRVVELCPVAQAHAVPDPTCLGSLVATTTAPWRAQRQAASAGTPGLVAVRADVAEWMDDPMFARWCVGFFPDVDELRDDVEFLAPEPIAEAIARTCETAIHTAVSK